MDFVILYTAMALDTLPEAGRLLLLAALLATALCGFAQLGSVRSDVNTSILLRKGALFAVLFVPTVVYVSQMRMPVYVDEMVGFSQGWPGIVTYLLLTIWLGGVGYALYQLIRQYQMAKIAIPQEEVPQKIAKRLQHWCKRLDLEHQVGVQCAGGSMPSHIRVSLTSVRYTVVMPAAARNWPTGVVDVCLLSQLAQIKRKDWMWALGGHIVAALFWLLPWVKRMALDFEQALVYPSLGLASAAYRDPLGWQRDFKQALQRLDGLQPNRADFLQLQSITEPVPDSTALPLSIEDEPSDALTYAQRRRISKERVRQKNHDPHEKAYWLIASACVVVALATTLTIVQAPPEFEPKFLHVKWQDQVARRYSDDTDSAPRPPSRSLLPPDQPDQD